MISNPPKFTATKVSAHPAKAEGTWELIGPLGIDTIVVSDVVVHNSVPSRLAYDLYRIAWLNRELTRP